MPKTPRQSRWIMFTLSGLDPLPYIKKCGCDVSQWVTIEGVIKGYLYFQCPKYIPKKKLWIPGAQMELTTGAQLRSQYNSVPIDSWINYGSNPLFVPVTPPPSPPPRPLFTPLPPPPVFNIADYDDSDLPRFEYWGKQFPGEWAAAMIKSRDDPSYLALVTEDFEPHELAEWKSFLFYYDMFSNGCRTEDKTDPILFGTEEPRRKAKPDTRKLEPTPSNESYNEFI